VLPLFFLAPLAGLLVLNLPLRLVTRQLLLAVGLVLSLGQVIITWSDPEWLASDGLVARHLALGLVMDDLSRVLLIAIGMVLATALLIGHATLSTERREKSFVNLLLVAMMGMNGTVLLADLFTLYVFVEITSVASFILIALERGPNALEGAFKYLILSAVAAAFMLSACAFFLLSCGATDFVSVRACLESAAGGAWISRIAVALFVIGLFVKSGLVPFHGWLPAAYSSAPPAVSVFLAGIATKVSGVYALIRLVRYVFTPDPALAWVLLLLGAVSIAVGALGALGQTDLKRMLAYSSISQVGYIILAVGCGTELALAGAAFHLFNHAIFKSLLFTTSAAVETRLGTTDMTRMGGVATRMPLTGLASSVALLSTAGIPPLSGFWSKLMIVVALWRAGHAGFAVFAVLASLLTLAYFLVMERTAFFGTPSEALKEVREAAPPIVVPALVLATLTLVLGVCFPFLVDSFLLLGQGNWW
jgi:multicomponent Na+:H+ antiporter subunit D